MSDCATREVAEAVDPRQVSTLRTVAWSMIGSFGMHATRATLFGLPAAFSLAFIAEIDGSSRRAVSVAR